MARLLAAFCLLLGFAFGAGVAGACATGLPKSTHEPCARSSMPRTRRSRRDDAKRAFSYAAPSIRAMFGTPERFLAMVRAGYPVVYRRRRLHLPRPAACRERSGPGRPSHRRRWSDLACHLPARAPDRRELANRRLRRSAGDRKDDLRRARRGPDELSRRRRRQHAAQVGALRRACARRRHGRARRGLPRGDRSARGGPVERPAAAWRACSAASSPARASAAAPKSSSSSGASSRAGSSRGAPRPAVSFNSYNHPSRLGVDRSVALIDVHHHVLARGPAQPALVMMVSAAVTIDALDAGGRFLGG